MRLSTTNPTIRGTAVRKLIEEAVYYTEENVRQERTQLCDACGNPMDTGHKENCWVGITLNRLKRALDLMKEE